MTVYIDDVLASLNTAKTATDQAVDQIQEILGGGQNRTLTVAMAMCGRASNELASALDLVGSQQE